MLRKFSIENYKNFQKKTTLDFTAVRDYGFNQECLQDGLLNKTILIGRNGSGKTNLGFALFDIVYTLTDNQADVHQLDAQSFINGNSDSDRATFIYEFQQGQRILTYEYQKTAPSTIVYEKLTIDRTETFEVRNGHCELYQPALIGAQQLRLDAFDGSLAFMRFIANNTPQANGSAVTFVMEFVKGMLYFRSVQDGNAYIGLTKGPEDLGQYLIRNGLVIGFQNFLRENAALDLDLSVVKIPQMPSVLVQRFKNKPIPLTSIASSGTNALELYYYWKQSFEKVSFVFIDEFDAFYHYELAENILRDILNVRNAQTVLTTHNTGLIKNELMRPDCYLQIEEGEIRSFSESTGRELREGHNLEKMLRKGEFDDKDSAVHR